VRARETATCGYSSRNAAEAMPAQPKEPHRPNVTDSATPARMCRDDPRGEAQPPTRPVSPALISRAKTGCDRDRCRMDQQSWQPAEASTQAQLKWLALDRTQMRGILDSLFGSRMSSHLNRPQSTLRMRRK